MAEARLDKSALEMLQGRVACKLAEIRQILVPGLVGEVDADALQLLAERHLESLAPDLQDKLRVKAIVAFAELERLSAEMTRQLDIVAAEMKKVCRHRQAVLSYRQAPGMARM